jgi:release factor glutamine methyltransferase
MRANHKHALLELVRRLESSGYGELTSSLSPTSISASERLHRCIHALPPRLRAAVESMFFARPTPKEDIAWLLDGLEPELLDLGIIRDLGPSYSTAELSLRVILGNWYFTQAPTADPRAYFGDDSLGLLWRLRPPREARCLDLCSGPGIQAIHAARLGGEVTAVEINPIAASLATINVSINELEDRVQVLAGDLYEPVGGRVFDHVFANPPLLPFPNDVHYPFVGHGGNDGMRVTKRIMDGLPAALSPHGSAQIIGTALSDGTMLSVEVELSRWCREHGMDLLITIVSSQDISPGSRLFESLVATSIASMESDVEMVRAELGRLTEELGTLCGVFLRFSHGEGNLDVQDISSANGGHFWFV